MIVGGRIRDFFCLFQLYLENLEERVDKKSVFFEDVEEN